MKFFYELHPKDFKAPTQSKVVVCACSSPVCMWLDWSVESWVCPQAGFRCVEWNDLL